MTDMPTYEVCDKGGNVKVIHWNQLFLVVPIKGDVTPLGVDADLSDDEDIH